MLEKILAQLKAFLDGHFVPKAELESTTQRLTEATERNATLEAQLAQANEGRTSESTLLTAANQQVAALTTERDALAAEVATLKAEKQTVDEAAAVKAREICAAQGIPANRITNHAETSTASDVQELDKVRAQIAAERDPKKRAVLAARARELRGHADLFKN
jgi:chromosome segregation ATPase